MATNTSPPSPTHTQSLWDRAFDSLNGDLKLALNQARTQKRDILAAVLKAAEDKRATCLRRGWKFKRSNGEVVIIRDLLEKIAKWIDRFKTVGDVAVQFDASSASLPWAAVRFLLQITVNDVQQFGTLVQDLEVLSRIIARYKEFEKLHLSRNSPMQLALETALTVLYTEVLTHLARTIDFFSKSTPVRIAQSVLYVGDKNSIQAVLSQEDEVWKLANLQDTEDLRFLTATVLRLRDQATTKLLDEESYMNMVLGLSTSPFPIHHQTISQSRAPDFGQWLLKHENYRKWCETSSSSVLWLHGIMGSGKTYLFSVVVDSLLTTAASHQNPTPFAHFYCLSTEAEPERSSADEILRSVLRQLAMSQTNNGVRDMLASEFERRSKSARLRGLDLPKLAGKECVDLIIEVANEDPIVILLDAVDQVQDEHRYALLRCLDRIMSLLPPPEAKDIMITRDNTYNDMAQFIFQKIDDARLVFGNLSSGTRDSLANALLDGAGEMFLWARHQIQQLRKVKREEDLLPALEANVLSDLDKLYENDLRQILDAGKASRQLAIQIFSWLLYMKTPLAPAALLAAIKTTSTDLVTLTLADVSALCSNLVIMD
ncbi:ankyrin 1, partial [Fusarium albosuccineum]